MLKFNEQYNKMIELRCLRLHLITNCGQILDYQDSFY